MVTWQDFVDAAPELAAVVEARLREHRHHVMATLKRDGAPRLSGTEVAIDDGELVLGMMAGSRRAADLRRDPRVALHSQGIDPPEGDDHSAWPGEAKVAGTARTLAPMDDGSDRFAIDIDEVVLTRIGTPADHLVIERWTPGGGLTRTERR